VFGTQRGAQTNPETPLQIRNVKFTVRSVMKN
jgi:hypothetical protein